MSRNTLTSPDIQPGAFCGVASGGAHSMNIGVYGTTVDSNSSCGTLPSAHLVRDSIMPEPYPIFIVYDSPCTVFSIPDGGCVEWEPDDDIVDGFSWGEE